MANKQDTKKKTDKKTTNTKKVVTKNTKVKKEAVKKVAKKKDSTLKKTSSKKVTSNKKVNKTTRKVTEKKKATTSKTKKVIEKKTARKKIEKTIESPVLTIQENVTVLDSNNTFPTDIVYNPELPYGYEPEVRVSDIKDSEIKKRSKTGIFMNIVIISLLLVIVCYVGINVVNLFKVSGNTTYRLSDLSSVTVSTDDTISIPSTWTLTTDGKAFINDPNEVKMALYVDTVSVVDFEKLVESLGATYITTEKDLNGGVLYYIDNIYDNSNEDLEVDYFFFYRDNILIEIVFSGCNYSTEKRIVESLGK